MVEEDVRMSAFATPERTVPSGSVMPCEDEDPTAVRMPVVSSLNPTPFASACHGMSVEPEAVVKCPKTPVPVFEAVSVHLNRSFAPVVALKVKRDVFAPIVKERFVEGLVSEDQEDDPPPADHVHTEGSAAVQDRNVFPEVG